MQNQYLKMTQIIMKSIKKLSPTQYQQLLDGKGRLIFEEIAAKPVEVSNTDTSLLEERKKTINTYDSKDAAFKYLMKFKKKELIELAKHLNVRVLSSDTKAKLSNKIIDLLIGMKIRKKLFDEIKVNK